jgi:hypothetical protein
MTDDNNKPPNGAAPSSAENRGTNRPGAESLSAKLGSKPSRRSFERRPSHPSFRGSSCTCPSIGWRADFCRSSRRGSRRCGATVRRRVDCRSDRGSTLPTIADAGTSGYRDGCFCRRSCGLEGAVHVDPQSGHGSQASFLPRSTVPTRVSEGCSDGISRFVAARVGCSSQDSTLPRAGDARNGRDEVSRLQAERVCPEQAGSSGTRVGDDGVGTTARTCHEGWT